MGTMSDRDKRPPLSPPVTCERKIYLLENKHWEVMQLSGIITGLANSSVVGEKRDNYFVPGPMN